jgi:hypothetical protein
VHRIEGNKTRILFVRNYLVILSRSPPVLSSQIRQTTGGEGDVNASGVSKNGNGMSPTSPDDGPLSPISPTSGYALPNGPFGSVPIATFLAIYDLRNGVIMYQASFADDADDHGGGGGGKRNRKATSTRNGIQDVVVSGSRLYIVTRKGRVSYYTHNCVKCFSF